MTGVAELRRFIADEAARLAAAPASLPFAPDEYERRRRRLAQEMAAADIDLLVITAPDTMCWLTGYASRWYRAGASTTMPPTQCIVVHAEHDTPVMIETGFHEQLVRLTSTITDFRPVPHSDLNHEPGLEEFVAFLSATLGSEGWLAGRVGLELYSWVPSPAVAQAVVQMLSDAGAVPVDATRVARRARMCKSAVEIAAIERAQAACDAGLRRLQAEVRPGMTGLDAWQRYMRGVIDAGGEPSAMHETVFAGPPEPLAHMLSTHDRFAPGAYLHADAAAGYHRYHARGTRVFSLGAPRRELVELTDIAGGALDVVRDVGRAGIPWHALQEALCDYYHDAGLSPEEWFAGGYELGVSLAPDWVGELSWSASGDPVTDEIPDGLVTNIESCAHVAIVDTVVFEREGARTLSSVPTSVLVADG